jgi:hypothetical protein
MKKYIITIVLIAFLVRMTYLLFHFELGYFGVFVAIMWAYMVYQILKWWFYGIFHKGNPNFHNRQLPG